MQTETHPYVKKTGFKDQLLLTEEQILKEGFLDGGIWFPDTLTVICGTFPPKNEYHNRKGYIHFSSPKNQLWKHIDSIYNTKLFIPSTVANVRNKRIQNSLERISFIKKNKIGFIDIFTKISRKKEASSSDEDLNEIETIFTNNIFDEIINSSVQQFIFVYSLSLEKFLEKISDKSSLTTERNYNLDGIPLETLKLKVKDKDLFLSYAPIHGRIKWELKQKALSKAINFDFK